MITDLVENKLCSVTKSDTKMSKSSTGNLLVEKRFLRLQHNEIISYMQEKSEQSESSAV